MLNQSTEKMGLNERPCITLKRSIIVLHAIGSAVFFLLGAVALDMAVNGRSVTPAELITLGFISLSIRYAWSAIALSRVRIQVEMDEINIVGLSGKNASSRIDQSIRTHDLLIVEYSCVPIKPGFYHIEDFATLNDEVLSKAIYNPDVSESSMVQISRARGNTLDQHIVDGEFSDRFRKIIITTSALQLLTAILFSTSFTPSHIFLMDFFSGFCLAGFPAYILGIVLFGDGLVKTDPKFEKPLKLTGIVYLATTVLGFAII